MFCDRHHNENNDKYQGKAGDHTQSWLCDQASQQDTNLVSKKPRAGGRQEPGSERQGFLYKTAVHTHDYKENEDNEKNQVEYIQGTDFAISISILDEINHQGPATTTPLIPMSCLILSCALSADARDA